MTLKDDKPKTQKPNTTVYVSNLSYRRDEVGIKKLFTRYGHIKKIKIVIDMETEKSRGMAFVEMSTVAQAKAAIEGLNGEIIDGRTLKASWAIPQEKPFHKRFDDWVEKKSEAPKRRAPVTKKIAKKAPRKTKASNSR